MSKIYVASSWRNNYQPAVVEILRAAKHDVYDFRNPPNGSKGFAWSDIDPLWEHWATSDYISALSDPIAEKGFDSDYKGMLWADVCVCWCCLVAGLPIRKPVGWLAWVKLYTFILP